MPASVETQGEQALRASELRYRRLFEAARDGILILDAHTGCIDDVNPCLCALLDLTRGDMLGKTIGELLPFKDIESNKAMLARIQAHGYFHYERLLLETRAGRKITVEFVGNIYEAGDHTAIQCSVRDITERKRAAEQIRDLTVTLDKQGAEHAQLEVRLIEAQKMEIIGQLAGGVAHDFNNILNVIMGYGDLIATGLDADSPLHKYTEEIRHASDRAVALTRQLLIFSRKHKVQPVVLDLNQAVRDMDKMLRRLIHEHISMTFALKPRLECVTADAGHIGQVLMNLVVNARDAMPNGGTLTITTDHVAIGEALSQRLADATPGAYVRLTVQDTGGGMTDAVKARVFEPFFTTKSAGQGTGLGLATCQTILQQSNGYIDVESAPGKGTTFRMYFPSVNQAAPATPQPVEAGPLPRGTETLLVVEDEPSVRHLARGILEAQGYTVLSASNGRDALHVARGHQGAPIKLVVTDVIMPLMGGKAMAEWLQITDPSLKVLFTSGYTGGTIAPQDVRDRRVAFLAKPYIPAVLIRRVREMLDRRAPVPGTS